jgi:hypothetical protein
LAFSPEHLLEIVDVVLRLLAVSVVHSLLIYKWRPHHLVINAHPLVYLMEQCQSLKVLSLKELKLDENYCRVLGTYSRPGLEIVLDDCKITSAGAGALVEVLGRNQGPTKLKACEIDNVVLANGWRGNSRLKSLKPRISDNVEVGKRESLAIAGALRENKGLVDLYLWHVPRLDEVTWGAIYDSLETHPTLGVLEIRFTGGMAAPSVIKSQIQALLNMVKANMSIHTIQLNYQYSQHELYRESVIPYLNTNRFRPRLLAIQRTRSIAYRAKVLGRALLAVRTDPNHFWMLLSGNAEIAFPSSTTTIESAANLLDTPTTAAATSTANAAAVAASVISALTTTATDSLPTAAVAKIDIATIAVTLSTASASDACAASVAAAANVATLSAGQKRKARP